MLTKRIQELLNKSTVGKFSPINEIYDEVKRKKQANREGKEKQNERCTLHCMILGRGIG